MSTSFEKIFNEATILQSHVIEINDYQLLSEDVLSLELLFGFNKPFIEGTLVIKDSLGIANLNLWDGNTTIKIYSVDIYGEKFSRVFRITGISNDEYLDRFKKYSINLIDELYYTLANTYLSKSFTEDPVSAFKKYMTELSLDTYLTDNKMTGEYDSAESYSFVVPQDRSVYDFFSYEFKQNGLRFWQSRKAINVKNVTISDLEYVQYEDSNGVLVNARYSNNSDNDIYGFKIHDFKLKYNEIIKSNSEKPVVLHQSYDVTKKAIDTTTNNLSDIYEDISLNDKDMSTLQHTTGARYDVDADVFINKQKLELEDIFVRNNSLEIVVPGNFKYNVVGYLAEVNLKGNPLMQSQAIEGDVFHSGKYLITKITDRYVGDKLIQKMILNRVDFQEPREV